MRKIFQLLILIVLNYSFIFTSYGQIIERVPRLQAAGIIDLKVENVLPQDTVNWIVTSYFIDEVSNEFSQSPDTIFSKGDSLKVLLVKKANKYTYYKIYTYNNTQSDSLILQVLIKGVPQKYLYPNSQMPGKPIPVYIVLPYDLSNPEFVMVMHGVDRNALDYVEAWKIFARANNYICAAPMFSDNDWPNAKSYNLGNMFTGNNGDGFLNPIQEWSFTVVKDIHDDLVDALGLENNSYDIWGHSAGAQFVHRLNTFNPDYKIKYAIAANAGWYTVPEYQIDYPYGLNHPLLEYEETFLEDLVIKNLVIMRGTADTIRDSNLNTSVEADAQGMNRFERALNYYNYGPEIDPNTKWQLVDVPDVGHDYISMALAAQQFLLNPTFVKEENNSSITTFSLFQNYPNPFNSSTIINYSVPPSNDGSQTMVKLKVFDNLGREVAELFHGNKNAGLYSAYFRGIDSKGKILPSGVYFYYLIVDNSMISKKMVLLK